MKFIFVTCILFLSRVMSEMMVEEDDFLEMKRLLLTLVDRMDIVERKVDEALNLKIMDEPEISRLNDTTIEERVTILEFQVDNLNIEVVDQAEDLDRIEGEIIILSADQVQQNERLLELEIDSDDFEDSIETLESSVTKVNSTLSEAVVTLDSDLTSLEMNVSALDDHVETELTEIGDRLEQLELTGTVAFQADLNEYTSIPMDSVVVFDVVTTNIGNGFDGTTGQFTVPTSGAGLYFFYTNLFTDDQEYAHFRIRVNDQPICQAPSDQNNSSGNDNGTPSCAAVTTLTEGDVVHVFYHEGTDDTPVISNNEKFNTFTGFRIAPE